MTDFATFKSRDLRLTLLRALSDDPGKTANESLLQRVAESFGFNYTREEIRAELQFLANSKAVKLREVSDIFVATLLQRGQDHLDRRVEIAGVNQPALGG